jgi:hypothetical protein
LSKQSLHTQPSRRHDPARTIFSALLFGLVPLGLLAGFIAGAIGHNFAFDFHTFWDAARAVTRGDSPYPAAATVAHSHPAAGDYEYFVYPPPFVIALLPFAALPFGVAAGVWTTVLLSSVAWTLRVLAVRDWRCYGLALATVPVLSAIRLGAATPVLMLLIALAWRHRDNSLKAGAAFGCAVTIKLFMWPLALWLLATRRWRAAAVAIGGALATTAIAWWTLDFDGLHQYPSLLRALSDVEGHESYSLVALAERVGLPDPSRSWLLLASPLVIALTLRCLKTDRDQFDRTSYTTAIGIALLLTPIAWLNYFALLVVPVALRRQTIGLEWAPLALFWLAPSPEPMNHPLWQLVVVLVLTLLVIWWSQHAHPRLRRRRHPSVHRIRRVALGADRTG